MQIILNVHVLEDEHSKHSQKYTNVCILVHFGKDEKYGDVFCSFGEGRRLMI